MRYEFTKFEYKTNIWNKSNKTKSNLFLPLGPAQQGQLGLWPIRPNIRTGRGKQRRGSPAAELAVGGISSETKHTTMTLSTRRNDWCAKCTPRPNLAPLTASTMADGHVAAAMRWWWGCIGQAELGTSFPRAKRRGPSRKRREEEALAVSTMASMNSGEVGSWRWKWNRRNSLSPMPEQLIGGRTR
jgi:hypothetical protein